MTWFLVEAYAPPDAELGRMEARIDQVTGTVEGITHLASILLHEDETCFHIFDAAARDVVVRVGELAGLEPLRIVEATHARQWGRPSR